MCYSFNMDGTYKADVHGYCSSTDACHKILYQVMNWLALSGFIRKRDY